MLLHVFFGTEDNRTGWTSFNAGWFLTNSNAVRTHRAFVRTAVFFRDTRHIKWATTDAVTATDAILFLKIDNTVGVLHNRTRCRTGLEATWVFTVHTTIFTNQPFQIAVRIFVFRKTHHCPRVFGHVSRIVIRAVVFTNFVTQIIPFHTRCLACLTADTLGGIYELRYRARDGFTDRRWLHRGGGHTFNIKRLKWHGFSYAFSTFTKKDLNSGVWEFASPTSGVSVLTK